MDNFPESETACVQYSYGTHTIQGHRHACEALLTLQSRRACELLLRFDVYCYESLRDLARQLRFIRAIYTLLDHYGTTVANCTVHDVSMSQNPEYEQVEQVEQVRNYATSGILYRYIYNIIAKLCNL